MVLVTAVVVSCGQKWSGIVRNGQGLSGVVRMVRASQVWSGLTITDYT